MSRMYSHVFASLAVLGIASATSVCLPGEESFVAPPGFPTSAFSSYYVSPAEPTAEPQPALYDPVLDITFPFNLTNPEAIPTVDPDPPSFPQPTVSLSSIEAQNFLAAIVSNVTQILKNAKNSTDSNCTICKNALAAAQPAARAVPSLVPN